VAAELVAAEPRNDRMWWMLGWFYEADAEHADLDEARRLFESGLARAPETGSIPLGLARILLQQKEVTAARDVVDRALEPGGVTSGRRGLELLQVEIDERQARTLLDQGRGAEGERLLEALLASAEDPEVRGAAAGRLEIYRRLRADSALAERYQAAIALVNSQRIELGAEALREIVRDAPESQWAGLAKSDLEQVEAFLARKKARQQQQAAPPPPPR
jgi:predicted Zn-dependent protease